MKTITKTLFAGLFTLMVSASSMATTFAANTTHSINTARSFNKIWVAGNVKIILSQSEKEGVFVDETFNPDKTSVLSKGQTLYINTMESSQVTIRVAVKDLHRIEAAGSAVVVSSNNINVDFLQVFASQNAKVKVSAITGDLYTVVKEDAVLKMSGTAGQHTLVAGNMKNVKLDNLVAQKTIRKAPEMMIATQEYAAIKQDTVR
ncbi:MULTISPECIES: GIN domain-containing protein [Pedobacter]|uniref:GIN domain-containing protein n=1 Tax=Pedobacter TaxID=84567 RepID=UPI00210D86A2|nr:MULTISPECIES: DUF2807 domain-containing protein [unclassified Pedobacter]